MPTPTLIAVIQAVRKNWSGRQSGPLLGLLDEPADLLKRVTGDKSLTS
jgi:hypothetical protein